MLIYDIHVLFGRDSPEKSVTVKCHDTGVKFRVFPEISHKVSQWRYENKPYEIPEGATAVLKIAKADKTFVLQDGVVGKDNIIFELLPQAFTVVGTASAEVAIFNKDGLRITTATFTVGIPPECVCDCEEESEIFVDVLGGQVKAANDAADRAEAAAKRAEEAGGGGNGGGGGGVDGKDGTTFFPNVDEEGNLSWTNDGGLDNPETVNLTDITESKIVSDYALRETVYIGFDGYCYSANGIAYSISNLRIESLEDLKKYNFVFVSGDVYIPLTVRCDTLNLQLEFSALYYDPISYISYVFVFGTYGWGYDEEGEYCVGDEAIPFSMIPFEGDYLSSYYGVLDVNKYALLGNIGSQTMKEYTDNKIGEVEIALDSIIAIQNALIGGDTE